MAAPEKEASTPATTKVGAVLLCGGRSLRMGTDKALLPLGSETLVERATRRLSNWFDAVVVVASASQQLPALSAQLVLDPRPYPGPLAALARGLKQLPAGIEWACVAACDMPFMHRPFFEHLLQYTAQLDLQAIIPKEPAAEQPLLALYRRDLAIPMARYAETGKGLRSFCAQIRTRYVDRQTLLQDPAIASIDPDLSCLLNLNVQEHYQRAKQRLLQQGDFGEST